MPRNTAKDAQQNPEILLLEAMANRGDMSGMIERQEAQGQAQLVFDDTLPTEGLSKHKDRIEAAGGVIGTPVAGDGMFTHVKLPAGWKKVATGHSMWTDLVDDKGAKVTGIFYKASFYDRKAFI